MVDPSPPDRLIERCGQNGMEVMDRIWGEAFAEPLAIPGIEGVGSELVESHPTQRRANALSIFDQYSEIVVGRRVGSICSSHLSSS